MRIGFFSGAEISLPFLEALKEHIKVVVTPPPKIRGRGNVPAYNPVKKAILQYGFEVVEVNTFDEETISKIKSFALDSFVVFAFGKRIPSALLEIVKCPLNIHPSPLPDYCGASPIERQLMDGVSKSAVTIIKMNEKIDKGDIILQEFFDVSIDDDYFSFLDKVYSIGIPLVKEALWYCLEDSSFRPVPQIGTGRVAKKIQKEEYVIDWNNPAILIHNKVRALVRVGAYTTFRKKMLKILKTKVIFDYNIGEKPGMIVDVKKDYFIVKAQVGAVMVFMVQVESKNRMTALDFINGYRPKAGEVLGEDN
uniref:Methionyl-tRNA formyltransferase n=1 Tax=Caldisericum exile TaxID=693075 RepID=A0A7C4U1K6_9BACT